MVLVGKSIYQVDFKSCLEVGEGQASYWGYPGLLYSKADEAEAQTCTEGLVSGLRPPRDGRHPPLYRLPSNHITPPTHLTHKYTRHTYMCATTQPYELLTLYSKITLTLLLGVLGEGVEETTRERHNLPK